MNTLVLVHLVILQSTQSDGSGSPALLLAGPVAGAALYGAVYRYYRNADKTDQFERETRIALKDRITGDEQQIDEVRGTRERRIRGDNANDFRARVAKLE
jgi:hypothetical protein